MTNKTFFFPRILLAVCAFVTICNPLLAQDNLYYEVDSLNAGLSTVPDYVDRSTPRRTMEQLFLLSDREDFAAAAHLLDLSDIPIDLQASAGPEIARQLKTVIDRKVVVDWAQLVDRPDGFDASESSRAATSGMMRRSLLIWDLAGNRAPISIRLNRVKPVGGDPVWVFSRQTIPSVSELHNLYGPSPFERWLPEALRTPAIWGLMWWEFIGVPLLLVGSACVGFLTHRAIRKARHAFDRPLSKSIVSAAATPTVIAAVTGVVWWATSTIFVFSGKLDVMISPLVAIGFVTAALMLIFNIVEAAMDRIISFEDIDLTSSQSARQRDVATRLAAGRRLLTIVVFVVGTGIVLSTADVFRSLGFSILASAGALTLVLGFAARRVLGNIMSSLQIALNHSARIGDRVVFKDHMCHVERINFTYVQLRDWDGTRLVVPVEEFVSETFENWTLQEPEMLRILKFKLHPSVEVEQLRSMFDDVINTLDAEQLHDQDDPSVKVTGQDVFGVDVWFALPCADPNTSWDLSCEAREKLVRKMAEFEERTGKTVFPDAAAAEAA